MLIDIAISPCPNDTFIFYHLAHHENKNFKVKLEFADIEELNFRAVTSHKNQKHIVTKLSFPAYLNAKNNYTLINSGGALGYNCGPILISKKSNLKKINTFYVPGKLTTAFNLLLLFLEKNEIELNKINFKFLPYNKIIPILLENNSDEIAGIIIHEERFTYQKAGLEKIQDLGEWWHEFTNGPIPLGCIVVRNDYFEKYGIELENSIRESIKFAYKNKSEVISFVKQHSQSLENEVIEAHIKLYVNKFSENFGEEGLNAINIFFRKNF